MTRTPTTLKGRANPLHTLTSDSATILRFVERVRRRGAVQCCYEAGPCGFELQRALAARSIPCDVIALALIPRRPGDRIKTDRRDARQLAILYRAGALTAIHIPTDEEEAARDLLRCREDIQADLLRARHRLSKCLLRHGRRFTGTSNLAGTELVFQFYARPRRDLALEESSWQTGLADDARQRSDLEFLMVRDRDVVVVSSVRLCMTM